MERIRNYLNECFDEYVMSEELENLREELFANVSDHYEDLVRQTGSAEEAEETVLASLGDIRGLLQEIGAQKKEKRRSRVSSLDSDLIREFTDSVSNLVAGAFRRPENDGIRTEVYANVEELDIRGINMDTVICPSRDELVHVEAEGNQDEIEFEIDDGELVIRELPGTGIFRTGMDLKVEIPAEVRTVGVHVVSGDLTMDHVHLNNVRFQSTSGDLSIRHGSIGKLETETASGDLYIRLDELEQFRAELASGDIDLKCITAGEIICASKSGDIDAEIADGFESVMLKSVSGDISVAYNDSYEATLDLNSLSGTADAGNHRSGETNLLYIRTVSGDIRLR